MKITMARTRNGIQLTPPEQPEGLVLIDDTVLMVRIGNATQDERNTLDGRPFITIGSNNSQRRTYNKNMSS